MYKWNYGGKEFEFETEESMFSPAHADVGTAAMLSLVEVRPGQKILDLGCGCGIVGISLAGTVGAENVVMADVDPTAVNLAKKNAAAAGFGEITAYVSDGLAQIPDRDFDMILSNPPYHTDYSVAKGFIGEGFHRLKTGGMMVMVVKRPTWYQNRLKSVFGGVRMAEKDGYYIFFAEKRERRPAAEKPDKRTGMSKKLARKTAAKKKNRTGPA